MAETKEIKGLIQQVLSKLDKVDKIDSIEKRLGKIERRMSVLEDQYIGLNNKFDREFLVLEKRSLEHTKRLDDHDSLLGHLIKILVQ